MLMSYMFFLAYLACVPLANWMIGHVGTVCVVNGPCLIPVAPGLMAPSGVLMIGFALVFRDLVQRTLGFRWGLVAVGVGSAISFAVAPATLIGASVIAFVLSELADLMVYTPLQRRGLVLAVIASGAAGSAVDSAVFLWLAFHSLAFVEGQIVGKMWAVLFSALVIKRVRYLCVSS